MADVRLETSRQLRGFRSVDSATARKIAGLVATLMCAKSLSQSEFAALTGVDKRRITELLLPPHRVSRKDLSKIQAYARRVTAS